MPTLKNSKHEAFCLMVAALESDVAAYKKAYKCSQASAEANASRLRENEGVKRRIAELQKATATEKTLTMQERREFMAETARNSKVNIRNRMAAVMHDARLAGELIEKGELTGKDGKPFQSVVPPIILNLPAAMMEPRRLC